MSTPDSTYRGRFAPSPTGPLHLGSLVAALASYLDARAAGGAWLVRMEDLDPPREEPGAAESILQSLRHHGLHWDESVLWQGQRGAAYADALARLHARGHTFPCSCSRQQTDPLGNCRGDCRREPPAEGAPTALRVRVPAGFTSDWDDRWQGPQHWADSERLRDFVIRRKDGLIAYQLAVVVDDAAQGITRVVRGSDLLDSTPRQHCLQTLLDYPRPAYDHLPVLTGADGSKLSKQNHAPALDDRQAPANLRRALHYLNQPPPPAGATTCGDILTAATARWRWEAVPARPSLPADAADA